MAQNLPADLDLTLEQDVYIRLQYLGWLMAQDESRQGDFRHQPDYSRINRTRDEEGEIVNTPSPVDNFTVSFRFNPLLLAQAQVCGKPMYSAIESITLPDGLDIGCDFGAGGDGFGIPDEFQLSVLVDDNDVTVIDDNDFYPSEG